MRQHFLCIAILLASAGCQHLAKPDRAAELPPDAPPVATILADLTAPNRLVNTFSGNGALRMRLPGEAASQYFPMSHVSFQQPARFYAYARKGPHVVRIYVEDDTFLLQVHREKKFYFGREGDRFDDTALAVAPSAVFRELFLVDTLSGLDPEQVQMRGYDGENGRADVAIFRDSRHRTLDRLLKVEKGPEGWQTAECELFDASETPIARTQFREYAVVDGVYLPKLIWTYLPQADGEMSFETRTTAQLNREDATEVENVETVRESLLAEGYAEIRGVPGEGNLP